MDYKDFACPITYLIMAEPVITDDGHTFEKEAIQHWLLTNDKNPLTNVILKNKEIRPNKLIKSMIANFLGKNKQLYDTNEVYLPKNVLREFADDIKYDRLDTIRNKWLKYEDYRIYTESLEDDYSAFYLSSEYASFECTELIFNFLFEKKLFEKISLKPHNWKPFNLVKLTEKILFTKSKEKFRELYKYVDEVNQVQDEYLVSIMGKLKRARHMDQVNWLIEYDESLHVKLQERENQRQFSYQRQQNKPRRNNHQNQRANKYNHSSSYNRENNDSISQTNRVQHSSNQRYIENESRGSSGSQDSLNQDEQEYYNLYFQYFPSSRISYATVSNNGHYSRSRFSR